MNDQTKLRFLDHLQNRNHEALGFLPRTTLKQYIARHQVDIELHHNDPCGYLLFYDGRNHHRPIKTPNTLRIRQACIDHDLRLIEHGRALVTRLINRATVLGYRHITAWVATDLPANQFWTSMGFNRDGMRENRGRRHPAHFHYTYNIEPTARDFSQPFT